MIGKDFSVNFMLKELENSDSLISRALLKYGYFSFSLDILEYCYISVLTEREQYYLDNLNHEYNILPFCLYYVRSQA